MGPAASQTQGYDLRDTSDRGLRRMVTKGLHPAPKIPQAGTKPLSADAGRFTRRLQLQILKYDVSSETLPDVVEKYPRAQKHLPQYRLRSSGYDFQYDRP